MLALPNNVMLLKIASKFARKLDHNIWFVRKPPIFSRKLAKIAENSDHNIDDGCISALEYVDLLALS
jgi:hypothetical protein